ncbi:MAG: MBL fold metallo-hydrolase, partial [Bacteroidota bacterium]|nr:MBL fold metallo-hydrolase [Bacteroidota bacterium]
LQGCGAGLQNIAAQPFLTHQPVAIEGLQITAFPKWHDAAEPHSFIVSDKEITIGVFTDIGSPCHHLVHHFKQCHAAFLEANYDETMLAQGSYPQHLKKRISGKQGHLSNRQALELFINHKPPFMSHLFLSHLSKENNHPQLVKELFDAHAGNTQIVVASRYKETAVFEIKKQSYFISKPYNTISTSSQLSLF